MRKDIHLKKDLNLVLITGPLQSLNSKESKKALTLQNTNSGFFLQGNNFNAN